MDKIIYTLCVLVATLVVAVLGLMYTNCCDYTDTKWNENRISIIEDYPGIGE